MFNDITHLFLNTEPINRRKAKKAMQDFYRYCKQAVPEVIFVNGPKELAEKIDAEEEGFSFFDHNDIAHFVTRRGVGKKMRIHSDVRSLFWQFSKPKNMKSGYLGSSALLMPEDYQYKGKYDWDKCATEVWDNSYVTVNYKDKSFIVERPEVVMHNDRGFHCADGPAIVFRDGSEFYFWNSEQVTEEQLLHPERMKLEDIHDHSNKHMMIAMVGVDHYREMVKNWKPDVKGKFQKFMSFGEMLDENGNDDRDYDWSGPHRERAHGWMHVDRPRIIDFGKGSVNDAYGTIIKYRELGQMYLLERNDDVMETTFGKRYLEPHDLPLWNSLEIDETLSHSAFKMELGYQDKKFWLKFPSDGGYRCHKDVAPAWFRAKMFLGEDAYYETDKYAVRWSKDRPDGMEYGGDFGKNFRPDSLFHGNENLPRIYFDVELNSDSWEGLLEQWSQLAFDWIKTH